MWIFTETGFVSAVVHRDDPKLMMVRARDKKSLEPLAEFARTKIEKTPSADYPWRTVVSKKTLKTWMAKNIEDAEYDNFKSRVSKTRGYEFVDALHEVWSVMHKVEETYKKPKKSSKKGSAGKNWWQEHEYLDEELFGSNVSDSLDGDDSSDFWSINDYLGSLQRDNENRSRRRSRFS